jgi:hypothetical protein
VGCDRDFGNVLQAQSLQLVEELTVSPVEFVGDDPFQLDRIVDYDTPDQIRGDWY